MTLRQLVEICDAGYILDFPESSLLEFVDGRGQTLKAGDDCSDTLALFVVRELRDTYDASASDAVQLNEALRVMENARTDIDNVIVALRCARNG